MKKKQEELLGRLNEYNLKRQEIEKKIFEEAEEQVETQKNKKQVLVLGHENWHHGVIGIVSSKITDKYFKPSILVCFEGKAAKGSGRSIPGFDLHEALVNCNTYLDKCGRT